MEVNVILQKFEQVATYYLTELEQYSIEQFTWKSAPDEWSMGQVYNHLLKSAFYMQLKAIEECMNEDTPTAGEKSEGGKAIFIAGTFPPIKIKVPDSPGYTPDNPEDKEKIKAALTQLIEKMKETAAVLPKIPNSRKVQHPALGHLTAQEWFQLTCMHFHHHLRQKETLDAMLKQNSTSQL